MISKFKNVKNLKKRFIIYSQIYVHLAFDFILGGLKKGGDKMPFLTGLGILRSVRKTGGY